MLNIFPWKFAIRNTYFSTFFTVNWHRISYLLVWSVDFRTLRLPLQSVWKKKWNRTIAECMYSKMYVSLSFVRSFGFANKLRAGRMNAITQRSWIFVPCIFHVECSFCSFLSILLFFALIYMIFNGCFIEQWLLVLRLSHSLFLSHRLSPATLFVSFAFAFAFNFFWLTLERRCMYSIFSNWFEFQ